MPIDPFFGSVLAAGANVLGGVIGGGSANAANRASEAAVDAQLKRQDELAHHGIQYRAQDIMRAYKQTGIHPLALLGVQGPTYTPVSAAFTQSPVGEAIGRAGSDISRGLHATADRELRGAALRMQESALNSAAERGQLENELLRIRIASERARLLQGSPSPPMPTPASAKSVTALGNPTERYTNPDVSFTDTSDRGLAPVKGKQAQERLEDDWLGNLWWNVRNRILPSGQKKLLGKPSAGMYWDYDPIRGAWYERPYPWTTTAPIRFEKRR